MANDPQIETLPLDGIKLMEEAKRLTGLTDFGDESLSVRVAALAEAMEHAGLDDRGRDKARATFLWLLQDRLRLFSDARSFGTANQKIVRPLLVTGEARCGTTIAQMLFGQDPQSRLLKFWEVMHPSPPPSLALENDPRIAQSDGLAADQGAWGKPGSDPPGNAATPDRVRRTRRADARSQFRDHDAAAA